MSDIDKSVVADLCEGLPEDVQIIVKAAYWQGCVDGLEAAKSNKHKIERQEDNVIFLKS